MVVSLSRFLVESHSATPGGILSHQKINCQHPDEKKLSAVQDFLQQQEQQQLHPRAARVGRPGRLQWSRLKNRRASGRA
jgi:hypothetical protein